MTLEDWGYLRMGIITIAAAVLEAGDRAHPNSPILESKAYVNRATELLDTPDAPDGGFGIPTALDQDDAADQRAAHTGRPER